MVGHYISGVGYVTDEGRVFPSTNPDWVPVSEQPSFTITTPKAKIPTPPDIAQASIIENQFKFAKTQRQLDRAERDRLTYNKDVRDYQNQLRVYNNQVRAYNDAIKLQSSIDQQKSVLKPITPVDNNLVQVSPALYNKVLLDQGINASTAREGDIIYLKNNPQPIKTNTPSPVQPRVWSEIPPETPNITFVTKEPSWQKPSLVTEQRSVLETIKTAQNPPPKVEVLKGNTWSEVPKSTPVIPLVASKTPEVIKPIINPGPAPSSSNLVGSLAYGVATQAVGAVSFFSPVNLLTGKPQIPILTGSVELVESAPSIPRYAVENPGIFIGGLVGSAIGMKGVGELGVNSYIKQLTAPEISVSKVNAETRVIQGEAGKTVEISNVNANIISKSPFKKMEEFRIEGMDVSKTSPLPLTDNLYARYGKSGSQVFKGDKVVSNIKGTYGGLGKIGEEMSIERGGAVMQQMGKAPEIFEIGSISKSLGEGKSKVLSFDLKLQNDLSKPGTPNSVMFGVSEELKPVNLKVDLQLEKAGVAAERMIKEGKVKVNIDERLPFYNDKGQGFITEFGQEATIKPGNVLGGYTSYPNKGPPIVDIPPEGIIKPALREKIFAHELEHAKNPLLPEETITNYGELYAKKGGFVTGVENFREIAKNNELLGLGEGESVYGFKGLEISGKKGLSLVEQGYKDFKSDLISKPGRRGIIEESRTGDNGMVSELLTEKKINPASQAGTLSILKSGKSVVAELTSPKTSVPLLTLPITNKEVTKSNNPLTSLYEITPSKTRNMPKEAQMVSVLSSEKKSVFPSKSKYAETSLYDVNQFYQETGLISSQRTATKQKTDLGSLGMFKGLTQQGQDLATVSKSKTLSFQNTILGNKQSTKTESGLGLILGLGLTQAQVLKQEQILAQSQILSQKQLTQQKSKTRTLPLLFQNFKSPVLLDMKNPLTSKKKKGLKGLFSVFVRESRPKGKGKIKEYNVGTGLGKNAAINLGAKYTDITSSRTFRIVPSGKGYAPDVGLSDTAYKFRSRIGKSKLHPTSFIEKSKFAIDTGGERKGITIKGLLANRKNKLWRL